VHLNDELRKRGRSLAFLRCFLVAGSREDHRRAVTAGHRLAMPRGCRNGRDGAERGGATNQILVSINDELEVRFSHKFPPRRPEICPYI
jgi:hypothetical protein